MPYIDLAGLSRYASRQKERLERDYALLRDMQWTRSEKAGAVSLWPVGGTHLKPTVDFIFTEVPPAEGDKGPDNPSTITGVSSVKVTRCGKNLLPRPTNGTEVKNGVTFVIADGVFTATGTAGSGNAALYIATATGKDLRVVQGHTYCLSGCPAGGASSTYYINANIYDDNGNAIAYNVLRDYGSGATYTASSNGWFTVYIGVISGVEVSGLVFKPQIEDGSSATTFEPPMSTNYTLPLGSTYYGGTLDVASGVMTVTHGVLILDGTELWSTPTQVAEGIYRHGFTHQNGTLYSLGSDGGSSCTHFNYIYSANAPQISYYLGSYSAQRLMYVNMKTSYATADAQKAWLASEYSAGHPVAITGLLYAPFTVQLDPVSISALAQSDKYTPRLNTVYTDASAVQVGYVKSPIRDEYELTQAITAQGGNV